MRWLANKPRLRSVVTNTALLAFFYGCTTANPAYDPSSIPDGGTNSDRYSPADGTIEEQSPDGYPKIDVVPAKKPAGVDVLIVVDNRLKNETAYCL